MGILFYALPCSTSVPDYSLHGDLVAPVFSTRSTNAPGAYPCLSPPRRLRLHATVARIVPRTCGRRLPQLAGPTARLTEGLAKSCLFLASRSLRDLQVPAYRVEQSRSRNGTHPGGLVRKKDFPTLPPSITCRPASHVICPRCAGAGTPVIQPVIVCTLYTGPD